MESDVFHLLLEMLGAREKSIRLALLAPYERCSMAKIISVITDAGGTILTFDTFLGEDSSNWDCTLKVADVTEEAVRPHVLDVVDMTGRR